MDSQVIPRRDCGECRTALIAFFENPFTEDDLYLVSSWALACTQACANSQLLSAHAFAVAEGSAIRFPRVVSDA